MYTSREILLVLNKVFNGNFDLMLDAIQKKYEVDEDKYKDISKSVNHKFVTLLDDSYPVKLKQAYKPPFVLFYEGDLKLLNDDNLIFIARKTNDGYENAEIISQISECYTIVSTFEAKEDAEILKIVMKNKGKFILIVNKSLDELDFNDPVVSYALNNECLILTEIGFKSKNHNTLYKNRIIAPLVSGAFLISSSRNDTDIKLLVESVLDAGGNIYCLPEPPFKNSLNNMLIKEGAQLVDSFLDIQVGVL